MIKGATNIFVRLTGLCIVIVAVTMPVGACNLTEERITVRYAPSGPVRMAGTERDRPYDVRQGEEVLRTSEQLFVSLEPSVKEGVLNMVLRVSVDLTDLHRLLRYHMASAVQVPTSSCTARYSLKGPYMGEPVGGAFTVSFSPRYERWRCIGDWKDQEYWVERDVFIKLVPLIEINPRRLQLDLNISKSGNRTGGFWADAPGVGVLAAIFSAFSRDSLATELKGQLKPALDSLNQDLRKLTTVPIPSEFLSSILSRLQISSGEFSGNPLRLDVKYKQEVRKNTACELKKDLVNRVIILDIIRS